MQTWPVATSGKVIEQLSAAAGVLPSTVDTILRVLREAGLVPMGVRGRGVRQGNYDSTHLTTTALSFGGKWPSDSAEAALAFGPLVYRYSDPAGERIGQSQSELGAGDLATGLARLIDALGTGKDHPLAHRDFSVELCENPRYATLFVSAGPPMSGMGIVKTDHYGPPASTLPEVSMRPHPGVIRRMEISRKVFEAAGALWADTLDRLADPVSVLGAASPNAAPENETGRPAEGNACTQPRQKTGERNISETTGARVCVQPPPLDGRPLPTSTHGESYADTERFRNDHPRLR